MRYKVKRSVQIVATFAMMISLVFSAGLVGCSEKTPSKVVESGTTWTVAETFALSGDLTIQDGAVVEAPEGYLLTLTVNGVELPIAAGAYSGDIVITPAKKISKALYNGSMTKGENVDYRTGLFIDAGQVVEESSVTSALAGGSYDGSSASGMVIASNNGLFNGIMVNDTDYKISDVTMTANGTGGNDFTGFGAGIMVTGKSNVEIDNFNFTATGPLRHGIYVGGEFEKDNLTVTVTNSFLKTDGSIGEAWEGANMTSVPWMLGIDTYGHVRTQMNAGYANVTYKNSTLLSDGWGIFSTDDTSIPEKYGDYAIKLNVEDCIADITGTSGYGTYSIGACYNVFSNTVMGNTEYSTDKYGLTYAMIVANEYAGGEFVNGSNITARYGVMYHKTQTGITKVADSTFTTHGAAFLIKHCYPVIEVTGATLLSDGGVIVQLMGSDDPGMGAGYYTELLDPSEVAKDENHDIYAINKADTKIFTTEFTDVIYDAQASFSSMEATGDFYNSVTGVDDDDLHLLGQNMVLAFDDVKITGIISSATALHRNYSFYFSKETAEDGNPVPINAEGLEIGGKWETRAGMFGSSMTTFVPQQDETGDFVVIGEEKHGLYKGVIIPSDATYLGDLANTPAPAVNNGMIVTLAGGTVWTVTGTSYLTGLTVEDAQIVAPEGQAVEMTVNGKKTAIESGKTYSGDIVITLI